MLPGSGADAVFTLRLFAVYLTCLYCKGRLGIPKNAKGLEVRQLTTEEPAPGDSTARTLATSWPPPASFSQVLSGYV